MSVAAMPSSCIIERKFEILLLVYNPITPLVTYIKMLYR